MLLLTVVYGILSVITWSAFFYKVRDLFDNWKNTELQLLCLAIATFAAPFVLASPHVYILIDRILGVANIASLIIYICVAICLTSFVALLVSWATAADKVRLRHRLLVAYSVATLVVMTVFFFLGNVDGPEHPLDFDVHFEAVAYISIFLLSYQLLFTLSMGMLVVLCRRYARAVDRPWLRRGLRVVTAGAVFGLGYSVPKVVNMVWDLVGHSPLHYVSSIVAPMSASVAAALFAVGFTMPAWGAGVTQVRELAADYRLYRQLYPLWLDVTQAFPITVFYTSTPRTSHWSLRTIHRLVGPLVIEVRDGALALRRKDDPEVEHTIEGIELLLARQFAELRDAEMQMTPYRTPELEQDLRERVAAHGLDGDAAEVVMTAAQIASALLAHAQDGEHPFTEEEDAPSDGDDGTYKADLVRLAKVADAYATSPLVAEIRARSTPGSAPVAA
ncbi:MAB_1171c family putative transporter [Streptacidiphilus sp. EB103A]|uniref:MAB_1171c family putative transporter n=1 Tax=Streptacidiphilus sp. EB103A TaxID=3156275 RepID=UPI0035128BE2